MVGIVFILFIVVLLFMAAAETGDDDKNKWVLELNSKLKLEEPV